MCAGHSVDFPFPGAEPSPPLLVQVTEVDEESWRGEGNLGQTAAALTERLLTQNNINSMESLLPQMHSNSTICCSLI